MSKSTPLALRIPAETHDTLKLQATTKGTSLAEHVKEILIHFVAGKTAAAPETPQSETATDPTSQIAMLQAQNTALLDWIASTVAIYGKVRGEARYTHVVVPALPPIPTA